MFDLHKWPLFDPDVFAPFGFNLVRNQDLGPGIVLLFMPLTRLAGEVATYNLLILASFFLTSFGTYLLARELWTARSGAVLAGIAVGFCEYRVSHAGGHLNISSTQWIPFCFLFLERTMRRKRRLDGALAGLFFALSALTTWYYGLLLAIAVALYMSVRIEWWQERSSLRPLLSPALVGAIIASLLIAPFAFLYFREHATGLVEARPLQESQAFSASLADFLIPGTEHSFFGPSVTKGWRSGSNGKWLSEWQVYLGFVPLALAGVGAISYRKRRVAPLLVMAGGSLLLALGPTLYLTHPSSIPGNPNQLPLSRFSLPVKVLAQAPPFTFLRSWARMGFFVQFAVALLAAAGLVTILDHLSKRQHWVRLRAPVVTLVLILAILDTLAVPFEMTRVAPRPVDTWLSDQPGKFTVMEYPVPNHALSGPAIYAGRFTGKRIVMGSGSYPPNLPFFDTLSRFPESQTLALLRKWNVKYILVDEALYSAGDEFFGVRQTWKSLQPAIARSILLREVTVRNKVHVYELLA
ncbi:MAG: hypothetical protein ACR2FO_05330 [Actinomycetota bacterium]